MCISIYINISNCIYISRTYMYITYEHTYIRVLYIYVYTIWRMVGEFVFGGWVLTSKGSGDFASAVLARARA